MLQWFLRQIDHQDSYLRWEPDYTYKQEVSQLDFELKRSQHGTDSMLNKLKDSAGYSIPLFVEKSEVEQYRTLKLEWLLDERNEPKIELIYFTLDKVEMFIQDIAGELAALFIPSGIHPHGG